MTFQQAPDEVALQLDGVGLAPMLSDDEFWNSENAIARAQILQHPVIMANAIENLQQHILLLEKAVDSLMEQVQWLTRNR